MNDIVWLTIRRMRLPLIMMLLVISVGVVGLVSIPGMDPEGNPYHLTILEALYFISITTTTIGFGEIPYDYTEAQRLWTMLMVPPAVITWLYSIGAMIGLFVDEQFRAVLAWNQFSRRVRWQGEPFFIICGAGNTGTLVVQGLNLRGIGSVVVEQKAERVHRNSLNTAFDRTPSLVADASDREVLIAAGLHHDQCQGIIATTDDDHANLTIAITAKLLRPELLVLARSEDQTVSDNMASFGTNFVIDPYTIFANRFGLALEAPAKYLLQDWLISVPGSKLRSELNPPVGRWIICGVGKFGRRIVERLTASGIEHTVVDIHHERLEPYPHSVHGRGTEASTLEEAGIDNACGLVAGTGNDIDNLSIVMTARDLNSRLFFVARQEHQAHEPLFEELGAELVARRSLIAARRMLAIVTTPLLNTFLDYLLQQDEKWARKLLVTLERALRGERRKENGENPIYAPSMWVIDLVGADAAGLEICAEFDEEVTLKDLVHSTRSDRERDLPCVCLLLERGGQRFFLPAEPKALHPGDRLLFAGRSRAQREMLWTLSDPNRLLSVKTGESMPRGLLWRWLYARRKKNMTS